MEHDDQVQALVGALQALQAQVNALQAHSGSQGTNLAKPPKPDFFYGDRDATRVRQWCFAVETYYNAASIPAGHQVPFAAALLRAHALMWWQGLRAEERPLEWQRFKTAIIAYHQPISAETAARDAIARLTQRTSVAAYIKEFKDVALNIPNFFEAEKLDRFKRGLKPTIRLQVALANPTTFEHAVSIASQVDDILFNHQRGERTERWTSRSNTGPTPMDMDAIIKINDKHDSSRRFTANPERMEQMRKGLCFYCKEHGHLAKECPRKTQPTSENSKDRR